MAKLHSIEWMDRAECLEAFATSFGDYPPRGAIPPWWVEFEKWYQEIKKSANAEGVVAMTLRTEAFGYDDEGEDDDDDPEPESGAKVDLSPIDWSFVSFTAALGGAVGFLITTELWGFGVGAVLGAIASGMQFKLR